MLEFVVLWLAVLFICGVDNYVHWWRFQKRRRGLFGNRLKNRRVANVSK